MKMTKSDDGYKLGRAIIALSEADRWDRARLEWWIEEIYRVYPGFPTLFWGLSVFFVGDLMGKGPVEARGKRCAFSKARWARSVRPRRRQLPQGPSVWAKMAPQGGGPCVMSSWTAASSDCSRPVNNYVHVKTADLYRPNARLTPERQGYQVLTPFGKLGYSRFTSSGSRRPAYVATSQSTSFACCGTRRTAIARLSGTCASRSS